MSGLGPRKVSKKSWEQSEKSLESLREVLKECSRDFSETFGGSWARGLGSHFRGSFGISSPNTGHLSKDGLGPNFSSEIPLFMNCRMDAFACAEKVLGEKATTGEDNDIDRQRN